MAQVLKIHPTLTELNFSNNRIGDEGVQDLANCNIAVLNVCRTGMSAEGLIALLRSEKLTTLDASHNSYANLTEPQIKKLVNALANNLTLTYIDLSDTYLSDACLQDLAKALADAALTNRTFPYIDVSYNQVRDKGILTLMPQDFYLSPAPRPDDNNISAYSHPRSLGSDLAAESKFEFKQENTMTVPTNTSNAGTSATILSMLAIAPDNPNSRSPSFASNDQRSLDFSSEQQALTSTTNNTVLTPPEIKKDPNLLGTLFIANQTTNKPVDPSMHSAEPKPMLSDDSSNKHSASNNTSGP